MTRFRKQNILLATHKGYSAIGGRTDELNGVVFKPYKYVLSNDLMRPSSGCLTHYGTSHTDRFVLMIGLRDKSDKEPLGDRTYDTNIDERFIIISRE